MSTGPDDQQAVPYNTPQVSTAPWVMPGICAVRLIAGGRTLTEPLQIVMDPRIKTPMSELEEQFTASKSIYDDLLHATDALHEITVLRGQLKSREAQPSIASADASLESKLDAIAGSGERERGGRGGATGPPNLTTARTQLARIEHEIEAADRAPTTAQVEAWHTAEQPLTGLLDQWRELKQTDLHALNQKLEREHLSLIVLDTRKIDHSVEEQIDIGDEE